VSAQIPKTLAIITVVFILFSTRPCAAQRPLPLDEACAMALSTHESVRIAAEDSLKALNDVHKATAGLLPRLSLDGSYTRYSEKKNVGGFLIQPGDSSRIDVKLSQPLYYGGRKWSARRRAGILSERSRVGLAAARESVVITTAVAYYDVLKAGREIEIRDAALRRAAERREVASARYGSGEVTRSALLRAEAELARARAELTKARSAMTDAKNLLRRLTGASGEIDTVEPEPLEMKSGGVDDLVARALASRRDYRQSLLSREAAAEDVGYAKGAFLPTLTAEGLYSKKYQTPSTSFLLDETVSGSLVLSYPIFEGGLRKAELGAARSLLREAELKRLSLRRDIEVEVREAYNRVESVRAVMDSYRKQVSFAEEDYTMVFEQFKYGLATTVDVIDSDAALISAQNSLMNSRYDLEVAKLKLMYAVGAIMDVLPVRRQ